LIAIDLGLEGIERMVPELVQPAPQRAKAGGIDRIKAAGAVLFLAYETSVFQHPQMLRHRRPAHRHSLRDPAHGLGTRPQLFEHLPSRRIGQGSKGIYVSHNLP